jgi:hypothetical protein
LPIGISIIHTSLAAPACSCDSSRPGNKQATHSQFVESKWGSAVLGLHQARNSGNPSLMCNVEDRNNIPYSV